VSSPDVLVVGGGPAGATCARELARAGVAVALLDRAAFPRPKPCAGWITPEVLPLLGWRAEDYEGTLQPFRGLAVRSGSKTRETDFGGTVSFGILRREFDHRILREAATAGAAVVERAGVERVEFREDGVEVEAGGRTWRAPVAVGAGGHFCPLARRAGFRRGDPAVAAIESETRVGPGLATGPLAGRMELIVQADLCGYAWIVAKGEYLNAGIGGFYGDVRSRWTALLADLERRGVPDAKLLDRARGHAYRVYDPGGAAGTAGDRWLLVGDAGGFAAPVSGEGIRTAIETGLDAAATILEALASGGGISRESLFPYVTRVLARYGGPGRIRRAAAAAVRPFLPLAATAVIGVPYLRRRVLAERLFGLHPIAG
jgi:geranylgeranyl reductase family protein